MAKSPGMSTSRLVSSHEDSDNPRSTLVCFFKGTILLVLYVDDAALFSLNSAAINHEITSLRQSFKLTDEGELQDYLGTHLTKYLDSQIELQQKKTIDNCLDMLGMGPSSKNVKTHDTPVTEFRQPLQVQSHLEMPGILVQLGHTQRT